MASYRFSVTYSAVIDTGDIGPGVIQALLQDDNPDRDFSLFEAKQVDVDSVEYEAVK